MGRGQLGLYADNTWSMKGAAMLATLQRLGISLDILVVQLAFLPKTDLEWVG